METTSPMKTVIALLGLSVSVALAADVSEKNLPVASGIAPTDYIRVVTNNVSAKASPATLAAILGGGSQVWTNDVSVKPLIYPSGGYGRVLVGTNDPSTLLAIQSYTNSDFLFISHGNAAGYPIGNFELKSSFEDVYAVGLQVRLRGDANDISTAIWGENVQAASTNSVGFWNYVPAAGVVAKAGATTLDGLPKAYAGLSASAIGIGTGTIQAGVFTWAGGGDTNMGLLTAVSRSPGKGGAALLAMTYDGEPQVEPGIIVADSMSSGYDLFIGRTNNGAHVAVLDTNGVWKANGFRALAGTAPADVGGITTNQTIGTITLHITNGVIMDITNP